MEGNPTPIDTEYPVWYTCCVEQAGQRARNTRRTMPPNVTKIIQAAAVLLRQEARHQSSYIRLLKLLYIADRESLAETGRPITRDQAVAMKHGPVLSNTLNTIKGYTWNSPEWDRFISREHYQICLSVDPGNGKLSKYEIKKLQDVSARFADWDDWEIVDHTHTFPEWIKNNPGDSSCPIPVGEILEAVGRKDAARIVAEIEEEEALDRSIDNHVRQTSQAGRHISS